MEQITCFELYLFICSSMLFCASKNLTGSVSNQIFCFIPSNCINLEVNMNLMVTAHFNSIKIWRSTYLLEWPHKYSMQQVYMYTYSFHNFQTSSAVSRQIPPCYENEIAINIEFELNAIILSLTYFNLGPELSKHMEKFEIPQKYSWDNFAYSPMFPIMLVCKGNKVNINHTCMLPRWKHKSIWYTP